MHWCPYQHPQLSPTLDPFVSYCQLLQFARMNHIALNVHKHNGFPMPQDRPHTAVKGTHSIFYIPIIQPKEYIHTPGPSQTSTSPWSKECSHNAHSKNARCTQKIKNRRIKLIIHSSPPLTSTHSDTVFLHELWFIYHRLFFGSWERWVMFPLYCAIFLPHAVAKTRFPTAPLNRQEQQDSSTCTVTISTSSNTLVYCTVHTGVSKTTQ